MVNAPLDRNQHKCAGIVLADTSWPRYHPCKRPGKVEREGKWWCAIHDPEAKEVRRAKKEKEWKARFDAGRARDRLSFAAPQLLQELEHLVKLLEPMEQAGTLNVPGLATLNGAREAIKKARED